MVTKLKEDCCCWCGTKKIKGQNMLCPECQTKLLRLVRGTTCKKCEKSVYDRRTYGISWYCGTCINEHVCSKHDKTVKRHTDWLMDVIKKMEDDNG